MPDQTCMDVNVCFRADPHNHDAIHTGHHRGGECGSAMSSEPWPITGAEIHLVLQRAAHPLREPWRIFWKSGRRKSHNPSNSKNLVVYQAFAF